MTPADRYLAAAQSLVDLDLPATAAALCPTGIRGVAPDDVPAALARLSTCEMAAAAAIRIAWGLPDPEPYVAGSAGPRLEKIVNAVPWAPPLALDPSRPSALRYPTLDAPPTRGEGLWFAGAPGHPEHVDACVVDDQVYSAAKTGGDPVVTTTSGPLLVYSAVAGGQPPAPGQPGSCYVRLVARTLRWDGSAWVDEGTGRKVMAAIVPARLAEMYGGEG